MTITAKIIADSISPEGIRLTTFQLRYPRFIHAEELTHRILESQPELVIYETIPDGFMYDQDLSRNASSSRAIPVKRMIQDLRLDPVIPTHWGKNQPGMQAREEHDALVSIPTETGGCCDVTAKEAWLIAMERMIQFAEAYADAGYHKQFVNRLLEPWMHINVVCTATNYENFYALRRHEDAQPEIKALADAMWEAQQESTPWSLNPGEWHLPYLRSERDAGDNHIRYFGDGGYETEMSTELAIKVSVARCARVSYLTHDGKQTTVEEDLALYERLLGSTPLHASPAEHQATPDIRTTLMNDSYYVWNHPKQHGNLRGWIQYRKTLPNEFVAG